MATQKRPRRRAYIGNLRPRPNLSHLLYNNLFVPHCLPVKNFPDGDGIVIAQPKIGGGNNYKNNNNWGGGMGGGSNQSSNKPTSVYALVEFSDVEYAIQMLNGVQFDGRMLRVSKEKTNNFGGGGGGFGSSKWAGDDSRSNHSSRRGSQQNRVQRSKPSAQDVGKLNTSTKITGEEKNENINNAMTAEESINEGVESIISSEIKDSTDEVSAAIACTAAMSLLSSVDAFGLGEGEEEDATNNDNDNRKANEELTERSNKDGVESNNNIMTNQDFQSRCKIPLSELMAEYGEQDLDWKKQQPNPSINETQPLVKNDKAIMTNDDFQSRCQMPFSDLLAEYGEQDIDWKKDQTKHASPSGNNTSQSNTKSTKQKSYHNTLRNEKSNNNTNGMLAHFNKASIHLELQSFGYKYGAPSHSKQGFTYAQPLPPLDVRDLDRAPGHVAKFNGLSNYVKRALLNPSSTKGNNEATDGDGTTANYNEDGDEADDQQASTRQQSPMRKRANEIADEIIKVLVESIDEGGHGPISPLTMTVSIGSEYGRHRSVVLVEHLGVILRARLRKNDGRGFNDPDNDEGSGPGKNGIVKQPVSVGTRHRDVEARHTDEEAFGEDLKREARKAEKIEKAKRRQMMEGSGWDDDSW